MGLCSLPTLRFGVEVHSGDRQQSPSPVNVRPQQSRVVRWTLALQEYDIAWQHRTASKHGDADGLSRMCQIPSNFSFTKGDEVDALSISPTTLSEGINHLKRCSALIEQLEQALEAPCLPQPAPRATSKKWLEEVNYFLCTLPQHDSQPSEVDAPPLSISAKDEVDPLPTLPQLREAQNKIKTCVEP